MLKLTLDTNCVIEVEEGRENASAIQHVLDLHQAKAIEASLSAIGASERLREGGIAATIEPFLEKIRAAGFGDLALLNPPSYWGLTYQGYSLWGDATDTLEREIHEILFPEIEFVWNPNSPESPEITRARKLWKNAKCDVLGLWCHIKNNGDIFVTNDNNFHKETKKTRLCALGAKNIVLPKELSNFLENN